MLMPLIASRFAMLIYAIVSLLAMPVADVDATLMLIFDTLRFMLLFRAVAPYSATLMLR